MASKTVTRSIEFYRKDDVFYESQQPKNQNQNKNKKVKVAVFEEYLFLADNKYCILISILRECL